MPVKDGHPAEIIRALNELQEQGFIESWKFDRSWTIKGGATYGPYTRQQAFGFIEGCRAMGASI